MPHSQKTTNGAHFVYGYGAYSIKCQISVTKRRSSSRMCLAKSCFRFGNAIVTLDQERVARRTACTAQSSASWQSRPTSSSTRAWQIQERLGIPVCFCAPHHPWEKGTNENTNGLLCDFFPKGRSLDGATDAEVNAAYCGR